MTKTGINVSGPGKLFSMTVQFLCYLIAGAIPLLLGGLIGSNWGEEGAHNGVEIVLFGFYLVLWITWSCKIVFWFESTEQNRKTR